VVDDLLGLHATVTLSPYRMRVFTSDRLDAKLDEGAGREVVCMRCTVFLQSAELAPIVFTATRQLAVRDRERWLGRATVRDALAALPHCRTWSP